MPLSTFNASGTIAVVFIAGFAIQQVLQIFDPLVIYVTRCCKESKCTKNLLGATTDGDLKKALMALLSFILGTITALLTGIRLLALVKPEYSGLCDTFVTGLVLGTGTEAVNTVLKFTGYLKDAQKPTPDVEVIIIPSTVNVQKETTFTFRAYVKNGANEVSWSVPYSAGGTIDSSSGVYTAPAVAGTYQIMAVSRADPSKYSVATVTVTP